MKTQPDIEEAARNGQLSEQQATAISSAAEKAPEKTGELLDKARGDNLASLRERSRDIELAADEAAEIDRHKAIHDNRYLRFWNDLDGSSRMSGRFTPESAAAVINALVPFQNEVFDLARRAGLRERRECHAADALVAMAQAASSADCDTSSDADTQSSEVDAPFSDVDAPFSDVDPSSEVAWPDDSDGPDGSPPENCDISDGPAAPDGTDRAPRRDGPSRGDGPNGSVPPDRDGPPCNMPDTLDRPGGSHGDGPHSDRPDTLDRPGGSHGDSASGRNRPGPPTAPQRKPLGTHRPAAAIIRIDLAALLRGSRTSDEVCEIDGVGTVAVATARAMMTDSFLTAVITDGIDIRTVVHLGRKVTARQRTAILARDVECVVPGCHARTGLEIDHVEDWTLTKVTRIDALARLCHHHHHKKTYGGWRLTGPPGAWRWLPPPDEVTPPAGQPHRNGGGRSGAPPDRTTGHPGRPSAKPSTAHGDRHPDPPPRRLFG